MPSYVCTLLSPFPSYYCNYDHFLTQPYKNLGAISFTHAFTFTETTPLSAQLSSERIKLSRKATQKYSYLFLSPLNPIFIAAGISRFVSKRNLVWARNIASESRTYKHYIFCIHSTGSVHSLPFLSVTFSKYTKKDTWSYLVLPISFGCTYFLGKVSGSS